MLSTIVRQFVYFPTRAKPEQMEASAARLGLEPWPGPSRGFMGWRRSLVPTVPRPGRALLVFHGNAGCALDRVYFVEGFEAVSRKPLWDVHLFEYPGYGARSGSPSEKEIKKAAESAAKVLLAEGRPLFLLGESLGSGVASHLAGTLGRDISGIILVTPFTSLLEVARIHYSFLPIDLLMTEKYDSMEALKNYRGPAAFIMAEMDEIVPARLGLNLHDAFSGPKRLWIQKGRTHNTLNYDPSEKWWKEVSDFIASFLP
jgi:pimeloyl-ACP methyl ester carboxylesterase